MHCNIYNQINYLRVQFTFGLVSVVRLISPTIELMTLFRLNTSLPKNKTTEKRPYFCWSNKKNSKYPAYNDYSATF